MENGLFRNMSIDRISSPEELHDYMRVTSPRLWMILAAIVILLAGFIVYASTATMENTMQIRVQLQKYHISSEIAPDGEERDITYVASRLPLDQIDMVKTGMKLRLGKEVGHISWILTSDEDDQIDVVYEMDHAYIPMNDGEYDAELVLESTTPMSFLWN